MIQTASLPSQWPKEQYSVGAGTDPTPRLECGRQNPESISSLKKKKKRYMLEMIVLSIQSIHCIINRSDFIVWLQLKCYFVCILYSLKKLVCNNKATPCLLLGGRELAGWGGSRPLKGGWVGCVVKFSCVWNWNWVLMLMNWFNQVLKAQWPPLYEKAVFPFRL